MRIVLDRERVEPLLWEERVRIPAESLGQDLLLQLGPVHCRGRVSVVEAGFLLEADLDYERSVSCTRCLAPERQTVEGKLQVLLVVRGDGGERREVETALEEEDMNVVHLSSETLDTEWLIREQLILDMPMKPLCREECQGLCPHCGADRNRVPDCCDAATIDPRWSALEGLRAKLAAADADS